MRMSHTFLPSLLESFSAWYSLKGSYMLNPFVTNAPFLCPPENIRKPYGFLTFSGGREMVHWKQMG